MFIAIRKRISKKDSTWAKKNSGPLAMVWVRPDETPIARIKAVNPIFPIHTNNIKLQKSGKEQP